MTLNINNKQITAINEFATKILNLYNIHLSILLFAAAEEKKSAWWIQIGSRYSSRKHRHERSRSSSSSSEKERRKSSSSPDHKK